MANSREPQKKTGAGIKESELKDAPRKKDRDMIVAGLTALALSIITLCSHSIHPIIISASGFAAFFAHYKARQLGFLAVNLNLINLLFMKKIVLFDQMFAGLMSAESYFLLLVIIQLMAMCIYIWRWAMLIESETVRSNG